MEHKTTYKFDSLPEGDLNGVPFAYQFHFPNGMKYSGQSINIDRRLGNHANTSNGYNVELERAIKIHKHKIIITVWMFGNSEQMFLKEMDLIQQTGTFPESYNRRLGGVRGRGSMTHSQVSKDKIRKAHTRYWKNRTKADRAEFSNTMREWANSKSAQHWAHAADKRRGSIENKTAEERRQVRINTSIGRSAYCPHDKLKIFWLWWNKVSYKAIRGLFPCYTKLSVRRMFKVESGNEEGYRLFVEVMNNRSAVVGQSAKHLLICFDNMDESLMPAPRWLYDTAPPKTPRKSLRATFAG